MSHSVRCSPLEAVMTDGLLSEDSQVQMLSTGNSTEPWVNTASGGALHIHIILWLLSFLGSPLVVTVGVGRGLAAFRSGSKADDVSG